MSSPAPALLSRPTDVRVQYRCQFRIRGRSGQPVELEELIGVVKRWVIRSASGQCRRLGIELEQIPGSVFFSRGNWRNRSESLMKIQTDRFNGDGMQKDCWALRYEHPNSGSTRAERRRQWVTDIGFTMGDGEAMFAIQLSNYLRPVYVTEEPEPASVRCPRLVLDFLNDEKYECLAGGYRMQAEARIVSDEGDVNRLVSSIVDPTRQCPLLFVSRKYPGDLTALDGKALALRMAGLVSVYVADNSWVDKLTERQLPQGFQCWDGRVRIYEPGVDFSQRSSSSRHRYWSFQEIQAMGPAVFEDRLFHGASQMTRFRSNHAVMTLEDVLNREVTANHLVMVDRLKSSVSEKDFRSFEQMFMEEERRRKAIENDLAEAELYADELEKEIDEKAEEVRILQSQVESLKSNFTELAASRDLERARAEALEQRLAAYKDLNELPSDIVSCCQFFESAYPERLRFTARALKTAEVTDFPKHELVWQALWSMVHELHPLIFETGLKNIEKEYRDASGFELSMTEGKLTKQHAGMMADRRGEYEGEMLDFMPHIKLHSSGFHLRIHFNIHRKKKLLIVDSCGEHKETAGTARRKN